MKNRASNNNLDSILDAVLGKLYPNIEELPPELRSESAAYLEYKLHCVSHAEIHTGNVMFMNILAKYVSEPYKVMDGKMFIITHKEVWYLNGEEPLMRIYHSVQDSQ